MCKKRRHRRFFKSHNKRKDGLQSQCIQCQRKYRRQHYLKNKLKYAKKAAKWRKELELWWKDY